MEHLCVVCAIDYVMVQFQNLIIDIQDISLSIQKQVPFGTCHSFFCQQGLFLKFVVFFS